MGKRRDKDDECEELDFSDDEPDRIDDRPMKKAFGYIEDDGPTDEQMEYFKRGGR